jgi:dCTP deaminase
MSPEALVLFPELFAEPATSRTTGVLPSQRLEEMISAGYIHAETPIGPDQIQPSSIDLRLGPVAYRVHASFLPNSGATVQRKLQDLKLEEIDLSQSALFEKGKVYIVPLQEELRLPENYSGKANPKSSTGRLDVFTRLITDYGNAFEEIREGYKGKLYVEIVPLTFDVLVRQGARLNQLRVRRGNPPQHDKMLHDLHDKEPLVYSQDESPAEPVIQSGLKLSVDLRPDRGPAGRSRKDQLLRPARFLGAPDADAKQVNCSTSRRLLYPDFERKSECTSAYRGGDAAVRSLGRRISYTLRRLLRSGVWLESRKVDRQSCSAGGAVARGAVAA